MKELRLKYRDEYGETRRVAVNAEIFTVGRHPENDLCIPDSRLSREHVRIEQFDDTFYVSDSRSSNGTTLNGARLTEAVIVRDGDQLMLGGAIDIQIEIGSDAHGFSQSTIIENASATPEPNSYSPAIETSKATPAGNQPSISAASDSNSIPTTFFWLAPVLGLVILVFVGGLFYAFSGNKQKNVVQTEEVYTPRTRPTKEDSSGDETPTPKKSEKNENSTSENSSTPGTSGSDNSLPTPKVSADAEKIEQNAAAFLRRIAQNDPNAFLTGKQAAILNSKINQFKGSSQLAENLKSVKKNAAQFETLANSKNLKAQFLATAALARIGNNRGDPLAVANQMLPILSDLKVTLDNKLANDNLMIIAVFERGAAGKPRSLQSTLEALSKTTQSVSPREIRSIWFLREKDKITEAEFNFALQFLAIGAITQNPKDFNVNAEAVAFN